MHPPHNRQKGKVPHLTISFIIQSCQRDTL